MQASSDDRFQGVWPSRTAFSTLIPGVCISLHVPVCFTVNQSVREFRHHAFFEDEGDVCARFLVSPIDVSVLLLRCAEDMKSDEHLCPASSLISSAGLARFPMLCALNAWASPCRRILNALAVYMHSGLPNKFHSAARSLVAGFLWCYRLPLMTYFWTVR